MVKKATKLLVALTFFVVCKVKYDSAGAENEASSIKTSREDGVEKKEEDDVSQSCEEETKRRIAHLNKVCDRWKQVEGNGGHVTEPKPEPKNVQVNFVHKLMTCVPHKVGSESWRYFFEKLDERDRNTTKWKNTALPEWPEDLEEFKEFAIGFQIRNPFERLLSSYRYVFHQTTLRVEKDINLKILMKYGGYEVEDPEILKSGGRIFPNRTATFKEFVQFIIHGKEDFKDDPDVIYKGAASHWSPYHHQCNPCHPDIRPSHIISLENSEQDALCFLDSVPTLVAEDYQELYIVNAAPGGHSSKKDIQREHFKDLTRDELLGIVEAYRKDFELYGYLGSEKDFLDLINKGE